MTNLEIDNLVDDCAAEVLECLAKVLPDMQDDAVLGELVLRKALDTYILVGEIYE